MVRSRQAFLQSTCSLESETPRCHARGSNSCGLAAGAHRKVGRRRGGNRHGGRRDAPRKGTPLGNTPDGATRTQRHTTRPKFFLRGSNQDRRRQAGQIITTEILRQEFTRADSLTFAVSGDHRIPEARNFSCTNFASRTIGSVVSGILQAPRSRGWNNRASAGDAAATVVGHFHRRSKHTRDAAAWTKTTIGCL